MIVTRLLSLPDIREKLVRADWVKSIAPRTRTSRGRCDQSPARRVRTRRREARPFEREAKLLASLNQSQHRIHLRVGTGRRKPFLVLELVEGQTLAERLKKGRIPLDETLDICRQITEGLEAAMKKASSTVT